MARDLATALGALWLAACVGAISTKPWPAWHALTDRRPLPRRHWNSPAESAGWDVRQYSFRRGLIGRVKRASQRLDSIEGDDGSEGTWFWRNVSMANKSNGTGTSDDFWLSVCRGSSSNVSSNSSAVSMNEWTAVANTSCMPEDTLGEQFTTEAAVVKACGGTCGSVYDVGCKHQTFGLCKVGADPVPSLAGSCMRLRIPGQALPSGFPRSPREKEFWRNFCAQREGAFHVLFKRRLCQAGKVLDGVHSEGACAAKVAADSTCSKVFDFDASMPRCRCVLVGQQCQAPAPPAGDGGTAVGHTPDQNVFVIK